uniref:Uncharacterized protein n=1 Tax=Ursus americanus TaxID=9643 RepID=A0A452QL26_URSAM
PRTPRRRTPRSARPGCGCPEGGWRTSGQPCRPPPPPRLPPAAQPPSRCLPGSLDGSPSRMQARLPEARGPGVRRTRAGRARDPTPPGGSPERTASLRGPARRPEPPARLGGRRRGSKSSGTPRGGGSRPQRSRPLPARAPGGPRAAQRACRAHSCCLANTPSGHQRCGSYRVCGDEKSLSCLDHRD